MHNGQAVTVCFSTYFLPGNNEIIWMKFEIWELRFRIYTVNFMVTPCINNIQHFIFQVMHTTLQKRIPSHSAQYTRLTGYNMQP